MPPNFGKKINVIGSRKYNPDDPKKANKYGLPQNQIGVKESYGKPFATYGEKVQDGVDEVNVDNAPTRYLDDLVKWSSEIDDMLESIRIKAFEFKYRGKMKDYENVIGVYNAMTTSKNFVKEKMRQRSTDTPKVVKKFHDVVSVLYKEIFGTDYVSKQGIEIRIGPESMGIEGSSLSPLYGYGSVSDPTPEIDRSDSDNMVRMARVSPKGMPKGVYNQVRGQLNDLGSMNTFGRATMVGKAETVFRPEEVAEDNIQPADCIKTTYQDQTFVRGSIIALLDCPVCNQKITSMGYIGTTEDFTEEANDNASTEVDVVTSDGEIHTVPVYPVTKPYGPDWKKMNYNDLPATLESLKKLIEQKLYLDLVQKLVNHLKTDHQVSISGDETKEVMKNTKWYKPFEDSTNPWATVGNVLFVVGSITVGVLVLPMIFKKGGK